VRRSGRISCSRFQCAPLRSTASCSASPRNESSLVVYYNQDVFQQFGVAPPDQSWTWDQFLGAARALTCDTDGDGRIDVHGLVAEPTIIRAAPFIWQRGGRLVDDDDRPTTITLNDASTQAALRYFVELSTVQRVVPNEAEYRAEGPDSRFMSGKAAMTLNSRRVVPIFRTISSFRWDVAAPPANLERATTLHSDAYCLAAASPNKVAAWDFTAFAIGLEGQQITARLGRTVPSLKSVATSPAFLDPARAPANSNSSSISRRACACSRSWRNGRPSNAFSRRRSRLRSLGRSQWTRRSRRASDAPTSSCGGLRSRSPGRGRATPLFILMPDIVDERRSTGD
jgi:hypothetical protein